jgi:diacylglycerol kinase family enzyme
MPGVHTVRSTRVELLGDAPMQIDGEYIGRSPATIEIVPDALTILVPESYG